MTLPRRRDEQSDSEVRHKALIILGNKRQAPDTAAQKQAESGLSAQ